MSSAHTTAFLRAKRRWQPRLREAFNVVRIPWYAAWGAAGTGYGVYYLAAESWHHGTIVWAVALMVGLLSLWRLYEAVAALTRVARWLHLDDDAARAQAEALRNPAQLVPPWLRARYLERRARLRDEPADARATAATRLRAPQAALAALAVGALLLAAGALVLPETFYYPVVWKYYYGPLVADYAGEPLTRGGVTAYGGYNWVDTGTWAIVLGVSLWNLLDLFARRGLQLTRALTWSLVPMIVAGGTMRGLIELDWIPAPWAYLFITPNIYLVFFFYTLAALLLGVALERRTAGRVRHWHATLAAGALAVAITWSGWAGYALDAPAGTLDTAQLARVFVLSALVVGALVAALWLPRVRFVRDPLYVLVLYGQVVDGMQNYLGAEHGHQSKLLGATFLNATFGDAGLLATKLLLFVPLLAYLKARVEGKEDANTVQLLLLAILALGLAMGFHGGVGMLLGR